MADVLIIGGGVAGLSAGITAAARGHRVTICERHNHPGGNLTGWDRDGYHIDNCIHWLTGTNPQTPLYRTWQSLGVLGEVPVYQAETLYTFDLDGKRLSLSRDIDRLEADMLALAPEDKTEIGRLLRAVRGMIALDGIGGADYDEKSTLWQKIGAIPGLLRYYSMTTGELADRFENPVLRGFLESLISRTFSALALIIVFATFCSGNGGIPAGSSCAMAERMAERFRGLGGRFLPGRTADRIETRDGRAVRVIFSDGTSEQADYVIVTADPATVFGKLIDKERMPSALRRQYGDPALRRFSGWHCAFACDASPVPFRGDLIFAVPPEDRKTLGTDYLILREFSHEKSFAPPGKSIIQSMVFCTEEDARGFLALAGDKDAYRERKRELAGTVERIITDKFPVLKGKLTCLDVWTPATYARFVGSEIGSFMGFVLPAGRLPRTLSCRVPGLENVLLATQWLQAPGGLPIAAKAGIAAAEAIPNV